MLELITDNTRTVLENQVLETEYDIVRIRQLIRFHAKGMQMGIVDQTRITTAVSELLRNMYNYAGGGEILIETGLVEGKTALIITCTDHGPGIENLEMAMSDGYTSGSGLGYGLPGAKRLVDKFEIETKKNVGTTVRLIKWK
jgi:serine/threonine-protein kinase RsbT